MHGKFNAVGLQEGAVPDVFQIQGTGLEQRTLKASVVIMYMKVK